jgi:hypothetical protein
MDRRSQVAAADIVAVISNATQIPADMIDERIKVPITLRWKDAAHFCVRVDDGSVVIDG